MVLLLDADDQISSLITTTLLQYYCHYAYCSPFLPSNKPKDFSDPPFQYLGSEFRKPAKLDDPSYMVQSKRRGLKPEARQLSSTSIPN